MNLNKIKTTAIAGMLAASMLLPNMTAFAAAPSSELSVVTKTVQVAAGVTLPDQKIEFTAKKDNNADGNAMPKDAPDTLTIEAANFKDVTSAGTLNQTVKITDAPTAVGEYTYKITENSLPAQTDNYGWSVVNKEGTTSTEYYLHIVNKNGKDGLEQTVFITTSNTESDIETATGGNKQFKTKVNSADFTNKFTKRGGSNDDTQEKKAPSLTIKKTVANGAIADTTKAYDFTVVFTADTNGYNPTVTNYEYVKYSAAGVAGTETSLPADGKISLMDGEYVEFTNIPAGTTVSVTEASATNVDKVSIAGKENGAAKSWVTDGATSTASNLTVSNVLIGENENRIEYTNTYKDVTLTGVVTDIAPYVTLVVVAVAAIAAYVVMKRRVAR